MPALKPISPWQFAGFRILFGLYLAIHFAQLLPYGPELFSREGVLAAATLSPTHGLFPNLLAYFDAGWQAQVFLGLACAAALALSLGLARRSMALLLWYAWTCLFNRNPLISNPGLPYVGLTLLLCGLLPRGEGLRWGKLWPDEGWVFPRQIYNTAFYLLMIGYTYSGLVKLASPSWVNGDSMLWLLDNPLARPSWIRDLMKQSPEIMLKLATWGSLALEISALPLALIRPLRPWVWLGLLSMHLGIMIVIDFADLTLGMVMIHLFTFDPDWLKPAAKGPERILFFDGPCALCDQVVRNILREDRSGLLRFAPLQGQAAQSRLSPELRPLDAQQSPGTLVYLRGQETLLRSRGVLALGRDLGGCWRILALGLGVFPHLWLDKAYDFIARVRYQYFGRLESCRLPRPGEKDKFLD